MDADARRRVEGWPDNMTLTEMVETLTVNRNVYREWAITRRETDMLLAHIDTITTRLHEAERALTYPDDPALSVASMLSKMSPEDKQAFNFCIKSVDIGLRQPLAQAEQRVAALEEHLRRCLCTECIRARAALSPAPKERT